MNLRVDLILPSEQRSASLLNPRTLSRIGTVVGPIILALVIAWVVVGILALQRQAAQAEALWKQTEPKMQEATRLFKESQGNRAILDEFVGWSNARVPWHEHLLALQQGIAKDLQLDSLRVSHSMQLVDGKQPARVYKLTMTGTGLGTTAQGNVQDIRRLLSDDEAFGDSMQTVDVPRYGADPENKNRRIFEVECEYRARDFK
jgi:hypothetical protein